MVTVFFQLNSKEATYYCKYQNAMSLQLHNELQ